MVLMFIKENVVNKERISVFEVLLKVFSMGAANIVKYIAVMFIPALVLFFMCFCSMLIITGAAINGFSIVVLAAAVLFCILMIVLICIPLSIGTYFVANQYHNTHEIQFYNIAICFRQNFILKSIGLSVLVGLITIAGYVLFLVPGIIFAYMLAFSFFIIIDNPTFGIFDIISLSKELSRTYKLKMLLYSLIIEVIPVIIYILIRGSLIGNVVSFIIILIAMSLNLLGLSFFYVDAKKNSNSYLES